MRTHIAPLAWAHGATPCTLPPTHPPRGAAPCRATPRRARPQHFAAELSSLSKAKIQVQRECEALRDMAAQAAAQHREELARYMQENAALKTRIASDAAAAAVGGRVPTGGKTFGALRGGGGEAAGVFEAFVAGLERRRRGLAPVLAVAAVCGLVLMVAVSAWHAPGMHAPALWLWEPLARLVPLSGGLTSDVPPPGPSQQRPARGSLRLLAC